LNAARDAGVRRFIHTSTSETYGTAQYTPIDETHPLVGQSPYSASKIAADKMVESFFRSFGLGAITVRPFNTFGPRQSLRAIIPTVIGQLLAEQKELQLGEMTPVRDMVFVKDTVQGFLKAALADENVNGQTINLSTNKGFSVGQIVDLIQNIIGTDAKIIEDPLRLRPKNSEVYELIGDNKKAFETLGWKPTVSLKEGLTSTIEFFEEFSNSYKKTTYKV
jgi:dTDP-glucose 4,6-dehydratase/UDP-glucose 4-epimerase